jgi:hypothetical protein
MLAFIQSIVGFLSGLVGLGNKVADQVHDNSERQAGEAVQRDVDQRTTIAAQDRVLEAEAKPHDDATTRGRLRDGSF